MKTSQILNKKGASTMNSLFNGLILLVVLGAVVGVIFTSGLNTTGGPTWLNTVLPIVVAAGIIKIAMAAFGNR